MAILQSCCFWRSVRKGSYASAIYTAAYFGVIVAVMSTFLDEAGEKGGGGGGGVGDVEEGGGEEEDEGGGSGALTMGENGTTVDPRHPMTQSFLEPEGISGTTMYFILVILVCACCGFLASLLLCCGLYVENRLLLIPWILIVVITSLVDLLHILYLMVLQSMSFNPLTSIVFTIDFFLLSINVYCLLCVVSQYQEYRAGRGTAQYEAFTARLPVIRYEAPQGPTSFLSSKKAAPSAIMSSVSRPPPILLTTSPEGRGAMTSPAAVAAEAAIAADIEARGAKATVGGEGANPGEGRITFIGVPGVEGLSVDEGKRREEKKRRRPQKRVQFPLDESCLEAPAPAVAGAEGGLAEAELGNGHHEGPFISEGGHRSVADSVTKSAMLFLSSSSVTAAAAVVVANDTAPLLSPKPPLSVDCSTGTAFFGGGMVDS